MHSHSGHWRAARHAAAVLSVLLTVHQATAQAPDDAPPDQPTATADAAPAARTPTFYPPSDDLSVIELLLGPQLFADWERFQVESARPGAIEAAEERIAWLQGLDVAAVNASLLSDHRIPDEISRQRSWSIPLVPPDPVAEPRLKDPRVARLYELLTALPPEDARRACNERFDEVLEVRRENWDKTMTYYWNPNAPIAPNPNYKYDIVAMQSAVLMTALVCDTPTLLDQLDRWKDANATNRLQVLPLIVTGANRFRVLNWSVRFQGEADPLFTIHLLMIRLQLEGKLTDEVLAEAHRLGLPALVRAPFRRWNARPTNFPRSLKLKGQVEEKDAVIATFVLSTGWGMFRDEVHEPVIGWLRGQLTRSQAELEKTEPTPAAPLP